MATPIDPSFLLMPANDAAVEAIRQRANEPYWYLLEDGTYALNVSFAPEVSEVTLGSHGADIYLPDAKNADISRKHCIFVYGRQTGAVVLCDKSKRHNTEVFDVEADRIVPISKVSNSVVVSRAFNRRIAIGYKKHYQFHLHWNADVIDDYLGTDRGSTTFGPRGVRESRYMQGEDIGAGAFGTVWKAVDLRDGKAMAVKRFHTLEGKRRTYALREVNNLLKMHAPNQLKHVGLGRSPGHVPTFNFSSSS